MTTHHDARAVAALVMRALDNYTDDIAITTRAGSVVVAPTTDDPSIVGPVLDKTAAFVGARGVLEEYDASALAVGRVDGVAVLATVREGVLS